MTRPEKSALRKMLIGHKSGCAMHRFSDQDARHCSCGRDEAEKELEQILGWLREISDFDVGGSYRYPDLQTYLKKVTPVVK